MTTTVPSPSSNAVTAPTAHATADRKAAPEGMPTTYACVASVRPTPLLRRRTSTLLVEVIQAIAGLSPDLAARFTRSRSSATSKAARSHRGKAYVRAWDPWRHSNCLGAGVSGDPDMPTHRTDDEDTSVGACVKREADFFGGPLTRGIDLEPVDGDRL